MTTPFADLLQPGETLLWQGRIGFNLTSSPVLTAILLALTAYVTASLWFIQSEAAFCAAAPGQAGCGFIYRLLPPTALMLTGFQCFDMLERRALTRARPTAPSSSPTAASSAPPHGPAAASAATTGATPPPAVASAASSASAFSVAA